MDARVKPAHDQENYGRHSGALTQ